MPFVPDERVHDAAHALRDAGFQITEIADIALRGGPLPQGERKRLLDALWVVETAANRLAGRIDADGVLDEGTEAERMFTHA